MMRIHLTFAVSLNSLFKADLRDGISILSQLFTPPILPVSLSPGYWPAVVGRESSICRLASLARCY
jgi:hypothetical protein